MVPAQAEQYTAIKPSIHPLMLMMQSGIFATFISLLLALVGGFMILEALGLWFALNGFVLLFFIIWAIVCALQWMALRATEYRFYSNRVECFEGFLMKNRKSVAYDRVTNVGQRRSILERLFGLGTVYLDTAGSSQASVELTIAYLENPDQTYEWVLQLTAKKTRDR